MEPDGIRVTRALPIDGALLADVLLRLRRDTSGGVVHWTLGDRGAVEVDAAFTSSDAGMSNGATWASLGRVWDTNGGALAVVTLEITPSGDDVELVVRPCSTLSAWWQARGCELLDLLHAVVDELGEELLWHARRVGVANNALGATEEL